MPDLPLVVPPSVEAQEAMYLVIGLPPSEPGANATRVTEEVTGVCEVTVGESGTVAGAFTTRVVTGFAGVSAVWSEKMADSFVTRTSLPRITSSTHQPVAATESSVASRKRMFTFWPA